MSLAIGAAIRAQVIADMSNWLAQGLAIGRVAINCSGHEFRTAGFADALFAELAAANVPSDRFEIEVTEDVVLGRGANDVAATLESLHRGGIKISLDDFGTGYASLVHLQHFPVDEIKLDRSFIAQMDTGTNSAIIKAIVALGASLELSIVAEGVETEAQADRLREIACDQAQGYLFGRPTSAERVPLLIRNHSLRTDDRPAVATMRHAAGQA